jgi:hypothetical protein
MMYLDGMLRTRLEAIQTAVKRIDMCFQYSIKMAAGIGTGKTEEQLKAEAASRSAMKNVIIAERQVRNTKHGFEILKASLAIIADVCSDVRLMYRGIKREHDLKQARRTDTAKSRSPSPVRAVRPISAAGPASRSPTRARPKSAPSVSNSPIKKTSKAKRAAQSATVRSSSEAVLDLKLSQASRVSYAEDFEQDDNQGSVGAGVVEDGSIEVHEDTYEEEINDMMRDMGVEDSSSRRVSTGSITKGVMDSDSIAEEVASTANSQQAEAGRSTKSGSRKVGYVEADRSVALSIGSGIEDEVNVGEHVSDKAAVMLKARDLALSRSASNGTNARGASRNNSAGEIASEGEEPDNDGEIEDDSAEGDSDEDVGGGAQGRGSYADDFEGDDALIKGAFGGDGRGRKKGRKVSSKHNRRLRSKKVANLIASDILGVPLAVMAPSQRNHQNVLHGILLANNIPIHVDDDERATKAAKLKPITVTDAKNRQIPIPLVPSKKHDKGALDKHGARATAQSDAVPTPSVLRRASSTAELPSGFVRCHLCRRKVAADATKHLPMQNTANDEVILERAKRHQRQTGLLFPKFQPVHVSVSAETQREWVAQQMALQEKLLRGGRRGSVALQKHDYPFCSWECVKGWALSNCTLQMKYHTEVLIDMAAGHTVTATEVGH